MAIAKLELNDLISYKGEVEQYIDVLQETQMEKISAQKQMAQNKKSGKREP